MLRERFDNHVRKFFGLDEEDVVMSEKIDDDDTDLYLFDNIYDVDEDVTPNYLYLADFEFAFEDYTDEDEVLSEEKPKTKKDEILENLNYLKSKTKKTKQDHDSIYTLEMVLKNMK